MRGLAKEESISPKELHRAFKAEHGQIPDDWLKENQIREACGFMPLDEAERIIKNGCVYDVTCMWRGGTHRLKFFWPEDGVPSKEDMQKAVELFYPGARLLAHYPCKDEPDNFMVVVPPVTENFLFIPQDNWLELDEEVSDYIQSIYEEEGEPLVAPIEVEGGILLIVEDHDTGEEKEIFIEKRGLWDNIHAKRKRGEKPAKKGDKDYPETLNVEEKNPCWTGYKRKKGTKKFADGSCVKEEESVEEGYKSDKNYKAPKVPAKKKPYDKIADFSLERPNPIKEDMSGMSQKSGDKRSTDSGAGMTAKGVAKYNSRTGGNLKTAVTTPPSKLKAGSKAAGRRKSFCARSKSWNGERGKAARARWNC